MARTPRALSLALAVLCLIGCVSWYLYPFFTVSRVDGDAADYLAATIGGFWELYTYPNAASAKEVAQLYFGDEAFRKNPWRSMLQRGDITAFTHFHVPASFYPHAWFHDYASSHRMHLLIPMMFVVCLGLAILLCLHRYGLSAPAATLFAVLAVVQPPVLSTAATLSPHALFLLAGFLTLWCGGCWARTHDRTSMLATVILLAASIATLELSVALVLCLALLGLYAAITEGTQRRLPPARQTAGLAALFLGSLFAIWPGGFLKGGYVVSYSAFAYLTLFRNEEYYGDAPLTSVLPGAAGGSYVILAIYVLVLGGALWTLLRNRTRYLLAVFFFYALVSFVAGLRLEFRNPAYLAHFTVTIWVVAALVARETVFQLRGKRLVWGLMVLMLLFCLVRTQTWREGYLDEIRERYSAAKQTVSGVSVTELRWR